MNYVLMENNNRQIMKVLKVKRKTKIYSYYLILLGKIKTLKKILYKLQEIDIATKQEKIMDKAL